MAMGADKNKGKKLGMAVEKSAEITEKVMDLRVLMAQMSDRQRLLFGNLLKGKDEVQSLLLADGSLKAISGHVHHVTGKKGESIPTRTLTIKSLSRIDPDSYEILKGIAKAHIDVAVGDTDYRGLIMDIEWFFQMVAPEAFQTIMSIMEDKKTGAKTRLAAAESVLDRAGYKAREDAKKKELPVNILIQMPGALPTPAVIEGETV